MQSRVKFDIRMNITDEETFSTDEHASVIRGGTLALDVHAPEQRILIVGKCGGRRRVELRVSFCRQAAGAVQVTGQARLLQDGAEVSSGHSAPEPDLSEPSHPAPDSAAFSALVGAGESRALCLPLTAGEGDMAFAQIMFGLSVLAVNPQQPAAALEVAAAALGPGRTGAALSGCEAVRGGFRQRFEHCDLYALPGGGVHDLSGELRRKYDAWGGPDSALGLPVTGTQVCPDGVGRLCSFAGDASLAWHPRTGPMVVSGRVRAHWEGTGAERGPLGYPTSDTLTLGQRSQQSYATFQNGVVYTEEEQVSEPARAALSGAQVCALVEEALRNRLGSAGLLHLDTLALVGVSDTAHDFTRSGNRVLTYRATGTVRADQTEPRPTAFDLTLPLQFVPSPHPDGHRAVRLMARQAGVIGLTTPLDSGSAPLTERLQAVSGVLTTLLPAPELLGVVPSGAGLLSFRVTSDGGIRLAFRPDGAGTLAAQHAQTLFDTLLRRSVVPTAD
ncbi:LGFP repeat-containing protein [Deinococcus koreensis]|nr:hypothetical protein [Deinococcus koreensis]